MRGTHLVMVGLVALSLLIGCASEEDLLGTGGRLRNQPPATPTAPATEQSLPPSGTEPTEEPDPDPTEEPEPDPSYDPFPDPVDFPSGNPLPTPPPSTGSNDVDPETP